MRPCGGGARVRIKDITGAFLTCAPSTAHSIIATQCGLPGSPPTALYWCVLDGGKLSSTVHLHQSNAMWSPPPTHTALYPPTWCVLDGGELCSTVHLHQSDVAGLSQREGVEDEELELDAGDGAILKVSGGPK